MTCYTYSVKAIIPESGNLKVKMKIINEEENKEFCEEDYFNFDGLIFGEEKKHFEKNFALDGVSLAELIKNFRNFFVKASFSQNLENSGFCPIFRSNFSYKNSHNF